MVNFTALVPDVSAALPSEPITPVAGARLRGAGLIIGVDSIPSVTSWRASMAPDAIVDHTGKDPVEQILTPFKFDIGRNPNPHLAFGIGEHFCLGSNLARLELEVIFRQLAKRLKYAELAGPVARLRLSFVGGIKHMPIRYKLELAG